MALERHNPAEEFDAMFRRHLKHHLKQGGAPVAPCAGFDADAASAYLERALNAFGHTQFETHLAGCAACRRHVIALARLSDQLATLTVKPPVLAAEPVWSRWYGTLAQWFDFSGWNRGWTAATACSLLLALVAAGTWRQLRTAQNAAPTLLAQSTQAQPLARPGNSDAQVDMSFRSTVPATGAGLEVAKSESGDIRPQTEPVALLNDQQVGQRPAVPVPGTPPPVALPASDNSLIAGARQPEVRAVAAGINPTDFGTQPAPPPPLGLTATPVGFRQNGQGLAGLGGLQPRHASSQITLQPNKNDKEDIVAELILPDAQRARDAASKPAAAEKGANDPAAAARNRELTKALKGRVSSFMPFKNEDARTKEADVKEAREQVKPLMQRLNGHTFYFENGRWIDEEYKSDTTLPIIPLTRGSERYQRVLIENPSLEQFFQLGQVIVVWKGKVYEVRK